MIPMIPIKRSVSPLKYKKKGDNTLMKTKQLQKKLTLSKVTVSTLDTFLMNNVEVGGIAVVTGSCVMVSCSPDLSCHGMTKCADIDVCSANLCW
jgi:hypothetical protein